MLILWIIEVLTVDNVENFKKCRNKAIFYVNKYVDKQIKFII